jgi:hypothetical protein
VGVPTVWSWAEEIADADRVEALLERGHERGRFGDTAEGKYYLIE